ncbi:MAG: MraY family glycosyltransferase [Acidimicrobiales bacterium]
MNAEVGSVAVFAVGAVVTFVMTFAVRRATVSRGLVVMPDRERVHTRPTPSLGGVAMAVGVVVAIVVAGQLDVFRPDFVNSTEPLGVLAAVGVMCLLGMVDDLRSVSPPAKVAGQVLAAMVLYFLGVTMSNFKVPFSQGYIVLSASILPLVTALWVIGIANAVNLMDGLDGLAAGVVAIASGTLCIYGLRLTNLGVLTSNNLGPVIAAACCGVCVGFLPHNFHRAKIFMGDTGAMVLGLLMAAATMEIGGRASDVTSGTTYFFFAPLLVPFFILGVPILDTALAVIRRAIRRSGVTERDLGHVHYRLMRLGHGHRRAVLLLWGWTLLLSGFVLYPTFFPNWNRALPFAVPVLAVALLTLFRPGRRRRLESGNDKLRDGDGDLPGSGADLEVRASSTQGAALGAESDRLGQPAGGHGPAGDGVSDEAYRRVHRRRFARHHPPMRG